MDFLLFVSARNRGDGDGYGEGAVSPFVIQGPEGEAGGWAGLAFGVLNVQVPPPDTP